MGYKVLIKTLGNKPYAKEVTGKYQGEFRKARSITILLFTVKLVLITISQSGVTQNEELMLN